jgi:glycosyltransferase involved in cell wall biosynthesis
MNELEDIRSLGFTQPICVIPNGIDVVNDICKLHSKNEKTMLFFGRIHPIKGIENLLLTWSRIFPVHRDWILRIVGPGDSDYINSLRNYSYSLSNERVYFESPVYGFNKYNLLSSCDLFVLPSYSENFGMTVAESLMCKTPVVVTKNSPWQGLEATGSGWWIDNDPQSLFYTIDAAMNLSYSERYMMGVRGRNWMINDFSWYEVAKQFQLVYTWLINQGKVPECVHF